MFDFRDLFQWERFITPSIIKIFYWLAVGIRTAVRPFRHRLRPGADVRSVRSAACS